MKEKKKWADDMMWAGLGIMITGCVSALVLLLIAVNNASVSMIGAGTAMIGAVLAVSGIIIWIIGVSCSGAEEKTEKEEHGVLIDYTGVGFQCGYDMMLRS